jgi:hemerythrin-like domain-containing protein
MRLPTTPIGALMTEHRLIQRVVGDMERMIADMEENMHVDSEAVDVVLDFFRTYADRCHHGKEEDILFARLAEKDLAPEHEAMMNDLVEGHRYARRINKEITEANRAYVGGTLTALAAIHKGFRALVKFYPEHIELEDHSFFKPAMEYFSAEERDQIEHDFEQFDRAMIHETYQSTVEALEAIYV